MFRDLMSRCTILFECTWQTASATCAKHSSTADSSKGIFDLARSLTAAQRSPPSAKSITRHSHPDRTNTCRNLTTFGCRMRRSATASRTAVSLALASIFSTRICFITQSSLVAKSLARKALPKDPCPSNLSRLYAVSSSLQDGMSSSPAVLPSPQLTSAAGGTLSVAIVHLQLAWLLRNRRARSGAGRSGAVPEHQAQVQG
mmetsp:Transcript_112819/g.205058  ORF Transcript_112819/g.205058 Transcript_112819/m.205058 type:complete len:201 (+) Transcript_112819:803-1405(+)